MKKYIIAILVLTILGFITYTLQQKFGLLGTNNLASALGSAATSSCQTPQLLADLQSEADKIKAELASLPAYQTTLTKQLATAKTALTKAKTAEATIKKTYLTTADAYLNKLGAADTKIVTATNNLKKVTSATTAAQKTALTKALATAKADYTKIYTAYTEFQKKYKDAEQTRIQAESQVTALTTTQAKLKSGELKAELTAQLDSYTNPTTGAIAFAKKKPVCTTVTTPTTTGKGITPTKPYTSPTQTYTNTYTTQSGGTPDYVKTGTCSIGSYMDQSSCESATEWVPASCSNNGAYDSSPSECEMNGGTYTQGQDKNAGGTWTDTTPKNEKVKSCDPASRSTENQLLVDAYARRNNLLEELRLHEMWRRGDAGGVEFWLPIEQLEYELAKAQSELEAIQKYRARSCATETREL